MLLITQRSFRCSGEFLIIWRQIESTEKEPDIEKKKLSQIKLEASYRQTRGELSSTFFLQTITATEVQLSKVLKPKLPTEVW